MRASKASRCGVCLGPLLASCIVLTSPGVSQTIPSVGADISATMERLAIKLPMEIAGSEPIRKPLEELSRERCDQKAIATLGTELDKAGYRREAANAYVSYSETCGGYAPSLRSAVIVLLRLTDYTRAATVASDLIKLQPFSDSGYYLRAVAYDRGGFPKKAIDDYITAIELFGNKEKIGSASYYGMARNYEKLGQFCDAILPIETWVALNPARNDTSQTRAVVAAYVAKGKCQVTATASEEVFALSRPGNVVKVPVSINGVRGQLRSLQADDVAVVVQPDGQGTFGEGVDGLLGMSFLSRFKLTIDAQAVKISNRKDK
jgi:tetratricopeptide (TPR) repeat protein